MKEQSKKLEDEIRKIVERRVGENCGDDVIASITNDLVDAFLGVKTMMQFISSEDEIKDGVINISIQARLTKPEL